MNMKKLLVVGVIVLFLGVAIAPSINANMGELSVDISKENDTLQLESEFQRIIAFLEMQSNEDCGCGDANTTEWGFPMICSLLLPFWGICFFIYFSSRGMFGANLIETMAQIGLSLNCYWVN